MNKPFKRYTIEAVMQENLEQAEASLHRLLENFEGYKKLLDESDPQKYQMLKLVLEDLFVKKENDTYRIQVPNKEEDILTVPEIPSTHFVSKHQDSDGQEYLLFRYVDGKSIMNWTKKDYIAANQYFAIGDLPIKMILSGHDTPIDIPDSYRS